MNFFNKLSQNPWKMGNRRQVQAPIGTRSKCKPSVSELETRDNPAPLGLMAMDLANSEDLGRASTVLPDGRVVTVGTTSNGAQGYDVVLTSTNVDGSLDTSFGDGSGKAIHDYGNVDNVAAGIERQPDGKILVVGKTYVKNQLDVFIARFLPNGAKDSAFGLAGIVTIDFAGRDDQGTCLSLQPDGKIVFGGIAGNVASTDFGVGRLNADGSRDQAFGYKGLARFDFKATAVSLSYDGAMALVVQQNGGIIVGGYAYSAKNFDFAVVRFSARGQLDSSFATGGRFLSDFANRGLSDGVAVVKELSNGNLLIAGYAFSLTSNSDFATLQLTASGSLVSSFGVGGKMTTDFAGSPSSSDGINTIAVAKDGSIIAAGYASGSGNRLDLAMAKYLSNGSLDTTFGDQGKLRKDVFGSDDVANDVDVLPDGQILLTGTAYGPRKADIALAKFNRDASNDLSFNGGRFGRSGIDLGGTDVVVANAVQPDGKLLAAGTSTTAAGSVMIITRSNANGMPDLTFGVGGRAVIDLPGTEEAVSALKVLADGTILGVGRAKPGNTSDIAIFRLTPDGRLDGTFGANGFATFDIANGEDSASAFTVASSGAILVAGNAFVAGNQDFVVLSLSSSGAPLQTFRNRSYVTVDFANFNDRASSILQKSDGRILLLGTVTIGNGLDFGLTQLNADGTLDRTFGSGGRMTTDVAGGTDTAKTLVQLPDGRIVATGSASNGADTDFALVGYSANGFIDPAFGNMGRILINFGGVDVANAATIQPDGKILVVGTTTKPSGSDIAMTRVTLTGQLDSSFGTNGLVITDFDSGNDGANCVSLLSDGRIFVGGFASSRSNVDFALALFRQDGFIET